MTLTLPHAARGPAAPDKIRQWIIPRLRPGCRVPSANWMARFLRISSSEGARHIRRVLNEAGYHTETRGAWGERRIYVVAVGRAEV